MNLLVQQGNNDNSKSSFDSHSIECYYRRRNVVS